MPSSILLIVYLNMPSLRCQCFFPYSSRCFAPYRPECRPPPSGPDSPWRSAPWPPSCWYCPVRSTVPASDSGESAPAPPDIHRECRPRPSDAVCETPRFPYVNHRKSVPEQISVQLPGRYGSEFHLLPSDPWSALSYAWKARPVTGKSPRELHVPGGFSFLIF